MISICIAFIVDVLKKIIQGLTVALTNLPLGENLFDCLLCLNAERCGARKGDADAVEVVFGEGGLVGDDLDEHRRYNVQVVELVVLDGAEEELEGEIGDDDELVAVVLGDMGDGGKAVDVAERQDAEDVFRINALIGAAEVLEEDHLDNVGNDVEVRNHDGFLRNENGQRRPW